MGLPELHHVARATSVTLALALLGCAASPRPAPPPTPTPPSPVTAGEPIDVPAACRPAAVASYPPLLTADLDERVAERAVPARLGAARFVQGGPVIADGEGGYAEYVQLVVVNEQLDAVRVAADTADARLLLWVDTADLALTPADPVRVLLQPSRDAPGGVMLLPGHRVTPTGRVTDEGWLEVRAADNAKVHFVGWVEQRALGHVFRIPATTHELAPASWLPGETVLRASPGGPEVARTTGSGAPVSASLADDAGWVAVRYRPPLREHVEIDGFVEARAISPLGGMVGGLGLSPAGSTPLVPVDTCLYAAPEGLLPIGVVTHPQRHPDSTTLGRDGDGNPTLTIQTDWGPMTTWLRETKGGGWTVCRPDEPADGSQ